MHQTLYEIYITISKTKGSRIKNNTADIIKATQYIILKISTTFIHF
jgi:hypothetical protein